MIAEHSDALRSGWLDVIARHQWDWFVTLTFRGGVVHPEAADKKWRCWLNLLNREVSGRRWRGKCGGVTWVRAMEYQRRGMIHFHAMVTGVPESVRRMQFVDEWFALAGIGRVEAVSSQEAVASYVSKYIVKDAKSERCGVNEFGKAEGQIDVGGAGFGDAAVRGAPGRVGRQRWDYGLAGAHLVGVADDLRPGWRSDSVPDVELIRRLRVEAQAAGCDIDRAV